MHGCKVACIHVYMCIQTHFDRRKFRSQTSDNMDRWKRTARKKLRHGESQKGEDKRWRRSGREAVRKEKMQVREKVGKSQSTAFFQCFMAPEGRKVGSLKRWVRSQLTRWEMNTRAPLWREAHFEVKMYKAHLGALWKLRFEMSKKGARVRREAHFESKW